MEDVSLPLPLCHYPHQNVSDLPPYTKLMRSLRGVFRHVEGLVWARSAAYAQSRMQSATTSSSPTSPSSDWTCSCGFHNFGFRDHCFKCNRVAAEQIPGPASSALGGGWDSRPPPHDTTFKKGDWVCECGTHNFARREECMTCAAPRPPEHVAGTRRIRPVEVLPGDWMCPRCGMHNFRSRAECLCCGNQRLQGGRSAESSWTCAACHSVNPQYSEQCGVCGAHPSPSSQAPPLSPPGTTPAAASVEQRHPDWMCAKCGVHNYASRSRCRRCGATATYAAQEAGPGPSATSAEGMWACSCGYSNYSDRTVCRECGAPREVLNA